MPRVSVLMAVRNEAARLPTCLGALAAQDYPADQLETIVGLGPSTDATREVVEQFADSAAFPVKLVENQKGSAASGFNAAFRSAHGDVIIILGARAVPEPSFVSASVRALETSRADAVGGVVAGDAQGLQAEAVALALGSRFGVGDARYRYTSVAGDADTVNYGAYRRLVFEELGGFDETMDNVEDDEFNYRLRAAGKRLFLSPEIRCRYSVRPSLLSLALQYARYGYPKVRVLLRHPRQMRPRQFIPAAFVASTTLMLAMSMFSSLARRGLYLLVGSYALSSGAASMALARRRGWRYLPLLPIAFACMHVAYGAASVLGAFRFGLLPLLVGQPEQAAVPRFEQPAWDTGGAQL